jgi:hypothetical protein
VDSSRCGRCGKPDRRIPGHPGHDCTAPIGGSVVKPGDRVEWDGHTGEVVEIDRVAALVHWDGGPIRTWHPLGDLAGRRVAS